MTASSKTGWLRKRPLREFNHHILPTHEAHNLSCHSSATIAKKPSPKTVVRSPSFTNTGTTRRQQVDSIEMVYRFNGSLTAMPSPSVSTYSKMPSVTTTTKCRHSSKSCKIPDCIRSGLNKRRGILILRHITTLLLQITIRSCSRLSTLFGNLWLLSFKKKVLLFIAFTFVYAYYIWIHREQWEVDREWTDWEERMQRSVQDLIPPLSENVMMRRFSHLDNLRVFPNLRMKRNESSNSREFIVPVPDYHLIGQVREDLARNLKKEAALSCQSVRRDSLEQQQHEDQQRSVSTNHILPVIGITVTNDTPQNRYLRRLLHTIDLSVVGSIVVTWFDENVEGQLFDETAASLSHVVIEEALIEYITSKGFIEMDWNKTQSDTETSAGEGHSNAPILKLASFQSLALMSQITTSIHQYCLQGNGNASKTTRQPPTSVCHNELLILRFPTNLGCSSGVNNPLFTHPTSPYWLIANYDIAYPPEILNNMGTRVQETLRINPDLMVHTFGYIYGRGKLENPWSNFVMTSCAVAHVGVWDEDIFPAYYEDDDFRDRIRYIMGRWIDLIGGERGYEDAPTKRMDDSDLIRYQTDRTVAVAHGPLSAGTYISGTHATMQQVRDEEEMSRNWLHYLFRKYRSSATQNPFHYESLRWKTVRELADAESFFRCKHGDLPDPGEYGDDTLRYFGWNERFLLPFVNETRVDRMKRMVLQNEGVTLTESRAYDLSLWSRWSFNATRRKCVHEGANILLSLPRSDYLSLSEERANLTQQLRQLCSVC